MHKITSLIIILFGLFHLNIWADNEIGKTIYNQSCSACHSPQMVTMFTDALGEYNAPEAHNAAAWQEEFWEELEELWIQGKLPNPDNVDAIDELNLSDNPTNWDSEYYDVVMDHLIQTVMTGKGMMTPGGACADCSSDDYRAAIEYMMSPEK